MVKELRLDDLHHVTKYLLEIKTKKNDNKITEMYSLIYPRIEIISNKKAFLELIKLFHPDRLEFHNNRINLLKTKNDEDISNLYDTIFIIIDETINKRKPTLEISYEDSEYGYDEEDFDDIIDINTYYSDNENYYDAKVGYDIIDAFKATFIGNDARVIITPSMISMTTGYIDFSNMEINNLNGIEYLIHIDRLNLNNNNIDNISGIDELHQLKELYLKHNNIDDIDYLKKLQNLEILDISNNDIEDLTPLLDLKSLKFVDVSSNNSRIKDIKDKLEDMGVIIIY